MRGPISIAVTGVMGLASEAYVSIKERDKPKKGDDFLQDEDEWNLDDAVDELGAETAVSPENTSEWLSRTPSGEHSYDHPLEYAVVIPQRRPKAKTRGFVRAYSPALKTCGIDQQTFMAFLEGFDRAIRAQSLFIVANVAIGAGVTASTAFIGTNPLIDIGAFLVHTTVEMGRRAYIAKEYNKYLIDMNEKLFKPRGLYALIMAYKPGSTEAGAIVDLNTNVAVSAVTGGATKNWLGVSSGNTYDEKFMPISAPLTFPNLEGGKNQSSTKAFKKASGFLSDYSDRRAQALWASNNPNSSLNIHPEAKFASKWSDPNHPVNHGGPLCVLTGGKYSRDAKKYEEQKAKNLAENRAGDDSGVTGGLKGFKRKLQEPTLYLMIVNWPSEEEIAKAAELKQYLDAQKELKKSG